MGRHWAEDTKTVTVCTAVNMGGKKNESAVLPLEDGFLSTTLHKLD